MKILQIGCNNCEDHVFDFVSKNRDSIDFFVVIDALPKCVETAKTKYSFLGERLFAINCAVADINGILKFFHPENDETCAHASLLQSHLTTHRHSSLQHIYVPCFSLNFILDFFQNSIDRLYIDMEGLDVITLLSMNFEKNKINYIEYEFIHSDGSFKSSDKHNSLINLFSKYNYKLEKTSEYNLKAELI